MTLLDSESLGFSSLIAAVTVFFNDALEMAR
jgi:hypothetical protein